MLIIQIDRIPSAPRQLKWHSYMIIFNYLFYEDRQMGFRYYQQRVGEAIERIERLDEEELEYRYRMAVYGTRYAMDMASSEGSMLTMRENRKARMPATPDHRPVFFVSLVNQ